MSDPLPVRALGVFPPSLAAGHPLTPAEPFPGVDATGCAAYGFARALAEYGARALGQETRGLFSAEPPDDTKRAADVGRESGVDKVWMAVASAESPSRLVMSLVDAERRTVLFEEAIEDETGDGWWEGARRCLATWLGREAMEPADGALSWDVPPGQLANAVSGLHAAEDPKVPTEAAVTRLIAGVREGPQCDLMWSALLRAARSRDVAEHADALIACAHDLANAAGRPALGLAASLSSTLEPERVAEALNVDYGTDVEVPRRVLRSRALAVAEQWDGAVEDAKAAVELAPEDTGALHALASVLEASSTDDVVPEAQAVWERLLAVSPNEPEALAARLDGLAHEDEDAALALFGRAIDAGAISERLLEAAVRAVDRNHDSGPKFADVASRLAPTGAESALFHGFLGALLAHGKQTDRATMHLQIAQDRHIEHPFAARVYALVERPGDFQFAAEADRVAVHALQPQRGDRHETVAKALADHPEFAPFHLLSAAVALQDERWDDAVSHGRGALERMPHNPEALRAVAVAESQRGELEESKGLLLKAVKLAPDHLRARMELFEVARQLGEVGLQRECAEVIQRLHPSG